MESLKRQKELEPLTKRYVWWADSDWAYNHPVIFLSNLMNLGNWDDIQVARKVLGDDVFKLVLLNAPPGYFSQRSWDYWHLKYGITPIPTLPKRKFL